jgi:hypothetical protein
MDDAARECALACTGLSQSVRTVVALGPELDYSDWAPLDETRFPSLRAPAAAASEIARVARHVEGICEAGLEVYVTGHGDGAVVAAYAAACARATLAHRGRPASVRCVVFGMRLCVDAAALGAVSVVGTHDAPCMACAEHTDAVVWLGPRDVRHYVYRALALVGLAASSRRMDVDEYAEAVLAL